MRNPLVNMHADALELPSWNVDADKIRRIYRYKAFLACHQKPLVIGIKHSWLATRKLWLLLLNRKACLTEPTVSLICRQILDERLYVPQPELFVLDNYDKRSPELEYWNDGQEAVWFQDTTQERNETSLVKNKRKKPKKKMHKRLQLESHEDKNQCWFSINERNGCHGGLRKCFLFILTTITKF